MKAETNVNAKKPEVSFLTDSPMRPSLPGYNPEYEVVFGPRMLGGKDKKKPPGRHYGNGKRRKVTSEPPQPKPHTKSVPTPSGPKLSPSGPKPK